MLKGQDKLSEENFWDRVAGERIYAAFNERVYNEIFDKNIGNLPAGSKVLDIGCASGVSSVILSRRNFIVKGIDISPKLIEQANRIWKDEPKRPIFEVGDAESLNIEGNSMDVCFLGGVVHHFPDFSRLFDEISRVLKKDGILIMAEPNRLDIIETISWFFAGVLNLLSPNEYPVDPLMVKEHLKGRCYSFCIYPIHMDDIPFLSFLPFYGKKYFKGGRGKPVKKAILSMINLFRVNRLKTGNFFILSCKKG